MSVIKAGSGVEVMGYAPDKARQSRGQFGQSAATPDDRLERLASENLALQRRVEALEKERLDLTNRMQAELKTIEARAYEDGRSAGLGKAHNTLRKLAEEIHGLRNQIDTDAERIERLSLLVSIDCLEQVFGDAEAWIARSAQAISTQLQQLNENSALVVAVSALEFAKDEDFLALCSALADTGVNLERNSALKAGEGEIKLELGRLEVGVGQQWARLRSALVEAYDLRVSP